MTHRSASGHTSPPDRSSRRGIRRAFAKPTYRLVRVAQDGFLIDGDPHHELVGRVRKTQLLRKLFRDHVLVCDSPDGIESHSGVQCEECSHPSCRPFLRTQVADSRVVYVIDLGISAARRLFALEDELEHEGRSLEDVPVRFTRLKRGRWHEIHVAPISPPDGGPRVQVMAG